MLARILAIDKHAALRIHAHVYKQIFFARAWTSGTTPSSGCGHRHAAQLPM
jgi:hypothetical protein